MKYIPALDGLRALAVLTVILFHTQVPHFEGGYVGVDLFFVLSGFLITTILLREQEAGGIRLGHFYLRRARRLYPALIGMVVLYLCVYGTSLTAWQDAGIALAYLSDYAMAFWQRPTVLEHTWSLAVEEHFYLLWPLLLPVVARLGKRAVYLLVAVFLAGTVWRMYVDQYADISNAGFRFDTRLTGLALGCALAFLPPIRFPWWVPALFLAVAAYWWWIPPGFVLPVMLGPSLTLFELCAACLVMWGVSNPVALRWGPLVWIGRISYGLYLYHYPVWMFVHRYTHDWRVATLWTLPVTFALATLSYYLLEARFRQESGKAAVGTLNVVPLG